MWIWRETVQLVPDLQLCLGAGTLVAHSGPVAPPTFGWKGSLPRDYTEHPDAPAEIIAPQVLPDHRSFLGGRLEMVRDLQVSDETVNENGEYRASATVGFKFRATAPRGVTEADLHRDYVLFSRTGVAYELTNRNTDPPTPSAVVEWRRMDLTPAWERGRARNAVREPGGS